MPRNLGTLDRLLRLIAGIGLLGLFGALEAPLKYLTLVGLPLLGSALTGWCPAYSLLGWSTARQPVGRP